jgi:hypothetical protein
MRRTRHTPRLPLPRIAVAVFLLATGVAVWSPHVGAQAQAVTVSTRTTPDFPKAGDDVTVRVRANGCPPGNAVVETYLVSSDETTRSTALITHQEFPTTLFFQLSAEVQLPHALEGWYGTRIVCGQYRPARQPITNTYFRVAPDASKKMAVLTTQVHRGGPMGLTGTACPGTTVEVGFSQSPIRAVNFKTDASLPVNANATWGGSITVPSILQIGRTRVRARCSLMTAGGEQVWINYDDDVFVDVLP